ncbi:hypothetical protein LP419_26410 [Massilia sp. H-1]|nr:hypothetical protein LP419_26410 [Massilia sp. H-1]
MQKLKNALPSLTLIALLIALWWVVVMQTDSLIFPTPWQVVTGTLELAEDGTLWEHIGASLFRVGTGFLIAVLVAVPTGLWMGRVDGVYRTLNPLFQILRPISPIAWIPLAILWFRGGRRVAGVPDLYRGRVPDDRPDRVRRAHDRTALPARGRELRRFPHHAVPARDRA